MGYGTEKIEDELHLMLPDARVQRMDLDTTRAKNAYQQIIQEFEEGGTDILVGTQMVSKGLDFDNVSMVGIFDADRIIHFPGIQSVGTCFSNAYAGKRTSRKKSRQTWKSFDSDSKSGSENTGKDYSE